MRNVVVVRLGGSLQLVGKPPDASAGVGYSYTFNIVGGIAPFVGVCVLPSWMSFSITGSQLTISGTPSGANVSPPATTFTITVYDSARVAVSGSYSINIIAEFIYAETGDTIFTETGEPLQVG